MNTTQNIIVKVKATRPQQGLWRPKIGITITYPADMDKLAVYPDFVFPTFLSVYAQKGLLLKYLKDKYASSKEAPLGFFRSADPADLKPRFYDCEPACHIVTLPPIEPKSITEYKMEAWVESPTLDVDGIVNWMKENLLDPYAKEMCARLEKAINSPPIDKEYVFTYEHASACA